MKFMKKWGALVLVLAVLMGLLGGLMWITSRPVVLKAAELTAVEPTESYPECQLSLGISHGRIRSAVFQNESTQSFYHGDPPDYSGLEVCLNGVWYHVPHREYATAGEGKVTGPGENFSFEPVLSPYGKLPNGQYRLSFGYWQEDLDKNEPITQQAFFVSYAPFEIQNGQYVLPRS